MLRSTVQREAIARVFEKAKKPLSVPDIQELLLKQKLEPNKTTVYRECERLKAAGEIALVMLPDGVARYERTDLHHHHHAVCEGCGAVAEVELPKDVHALEAKVERASGFTITGHMLEFLGLCPSCR